MFQLVVRCCGLLLAAIGFCSAQTTDLLPPSKLRPSNPSRFYPELVRLHNHDIAEIRAILAQDPERKDLAPLVTRQLLRKVPMDAALLARFLSAPSEAVQEWTLRTIGDSSIDKTAALPAITAIAADGRRDDAHRALAIRVLGISGLGPDTISLLVHQLPGASPDLRVILLEVIFRAGNNARAFVPELRRLLDAPEAKVQFHAFRALKSIDPAIVPTPTNAIALLARADSPKFLLCAALLELAAATNHPGVTSAILASVGHPDDFVAHLAANVLKRSGSDVRDLANALSNSNSAVRLQAASQLRELGPNAAPALDSLIAALQHALVHGAEPRQLGSSLDVLRNLGAGAHRASVTLVKMLDEQSPIYRNIDKHDAYRLRGFIYATLAEIGVPGETLPFISAALANADSRSAIEFAGAARAAAALGPAARDTAPFLARALHERLDEDFISFDRFDLHAPAGVFTTCQVEALRALRSIGIADEPTVQSVRAFLRAPRPEFDGTNLFRRIPNLRAEAAQTLAVIEVNDADKY